jgi:integrase
MLDAKIQSENGVVICQNLVGGYMYLRSLLGPEGALYMFYDDPDLIRDCMKTWFELADYVIAQHQKYVTLDELFLAGDICYNNGPLISPNMIREFLFPYYEQLITNIKKRQLDKTRHLYIQIDTYGDCRPVIPVYQEIGMDYMSPFEVASGCDVVEILKQYPDLLIRGGIDKRILAQDKNAIDKIAKVLKVSFKKNFTNPRVESFLSNKTIKHHHSLISAVLNKAVEWQVIKENVAKYIKPSKVIKKDIIFLNEEQVQILLNELKVAPHQQGVMIKLFLLTGLRQGELCGLEWKDIDNNTISIKRASQYIPDKGIFTKEPKTKSSIRVLPLSTSIKKLLDSHRKWQQNLKNEMSEDWTENDILFTTAYGTPIHPDTVTG